MRVFQTFTNSLGIKVDTFLLCWRACWVWKLESSARTSENSVLCSFYLCSHILFHLWVNLCQKARRTSSADCPIMPGKQIALSNRVRGCAPRNTPGDQPAIGAGLRRGLSFKKSVWLCPSCRWTFLILNGLKETEPEGWTLSDQFRQASSFWTPHE